MQIAVNLELLNFFLTFSNGIGQNPDPFFFLVGFKMQVSFAAFPAGISDALTNSQTHYSLLESAFLKSIFFSFHYSVCSFFGEERVMQLHR